MAEATRNRLPSGYDEDFVNVVEDEVLCLICQLPQQEPVLTRCGHRFCKDCLEEHFRRQKGQPLTCPADMQSLDQHRDIFPDKATERKILSLTIRCPSDGCEWTGELRHKKTHLASCHFKEVPCTNKNCLATMKRRDLSEHMGATCQWRIVKCEHCSEPHPKCQMKDHIREKCKLCPLSCPYMCGSQTVRKLELQDHLETCERFPVRCPNNCEAVIPREVVSNHIEEDCPLTKIPCPYARMGCRQEVQRAQLESHLQHETRSHLDLACFELNDTQEKVEEKAMQLDRLEERINVIQQQHQYDVNSLKQEYLEKVQEKTTHLGRIEEKVNAIQQQHQYDVNFLQQEYQQKVQEKAIQLDRLEEKVDAIQQQHQYDVNFLKREYQQKVRVLEQKVNTTQTELEQKLSTVRNICIFLVCVLLLLVCLMLYLTKSGVQKNLKEKVNVIQSQHEKKVSMVKKSLEDKVDSLNTNITSYLTKLEDSVQKKLKEKESVIQSQNEKKVSMVKKNLEEKVDSLHACLRVTEESRLFTWKITSFAIKLREAKNKVKEYVESNPFYMYGYKLKVQLHPNGYVTVKNTHLSMFIFVMEGEYDAMLTWPFKKKVKFTLIDQQKDSVERENVSVQLMPENRPECVARPTKRENIGYGNDKFISHEKLHSRRYLVDDTLFLQVEIGPSSSWF